MLPRVANCRVLLCDDQPDFLALLKAVLADEQGVDLVGEAHDGRECVDRAGELRPDLVLLDLNMPRMDGFEALPLLRATVPDTRVVVLTTARAADTEAQVLALGASGFVEKAGDVFALPSAIRAKLRQAA